MFFSRTYILKGIPATMLAKVRQVWDNYTQNRYINANLICQLILVITPSFENIFLEKSSNIHIFGDL